jgi:hypothetical protein
MKDFLWTFSEKSLHITVNLIILLVLKYKLDPLPNK